MFVIMTEDEGEEGKRRGGEGEEEGRGLPPGGRMWRRLKFTPGRIVYCIALYSVLLCCTALHCTSLHCTELH